MQQYPYYQAQVLNDAVFLQYGGMTGTSTQAQRDAAYLLGEEQMTEHLSAFLVPTIITGTALWRGTFFETEFGYIRNIFLASATSIKQLSPLETQVYTGSTLMRDAGYGYVNIFIPGVCSFTHPATLVYESGLSSGTVTSPTILSALTMAAQINLNEWDISLSNEGVADVGIHAYSNQSYSEQRKYLGRTIFGDSPMAQRIARTTRKYRAKPTPRFR